MALALVPRMSDFKPPSQNRPGGEPERARTATRRAPVPVPHCTDLRQTSLMITVLANRLPSSHEDFSA